MCKIGDIELFAPDDTGIANGNYFGFPFEDVEADLVLMSVPWDVTVSYGSGTSGGPQAIIDASIQVEIYDADYPEAWRRGIATLPAVEYAAEYGPKMRDKAAKIIEDIERGLEPCDIDLMAVNKACGELNVAVYEQAKEWLDMGKIVGLVGGDHSTPLGLIRALSDRGEKFGVLHIDAHADLREAYEGFEYSHASIMRNVLKLDGVVGLTQVGIRDFSSVELDFARSDNRVTHFTNADLRRWQFEGRTWKELCDAIIDSLPEDVYISFDIDGLNEMYCPSTGTPVPGGLCFDEAGYLIKRVVDSRRRLVGFDLTEVTPGHDNWDANVGARVLYKLCGAVLFRNEY